MIGPFVDMRGAVDVHVHSEPDLFPRIADDIGVVRHAASLGLRAISLKCHSERTTSRAYLTQQMVPGIQVVGGIVLNRAVGGLNPAAVESALKLGGKHVWMPTVDAANHVRTFGSAGAYDKQSSTVARSDDPGLEIVDADGKLLDEVYEVLDLVAGHRAILGTCHLSIPEIQRLVPEARQRGVEKILITHPFFKVPALDLDGLKELVAHGAYAEFGYCTVSAMWQHAHLTTVVEAIKAIGPSQSILMSDAGQCHNPMPAEALRVFAQSVYESGVAEDDVRRMISDNPLELLELPPAPREPVTDGTDGHVPGAAPDPEAVRP